MLESIAIRTERPFTGRLDLGEIAEALLFYGKVNLVLSEDHLTKLVLAAGLDTTLALVENDFADVLLHRDVNAVHTRTNTLGVEFYDFVTVEKMTSSERGPKAGPARAHGGPSATLPGQPLHDARLRTCLEVVSEAFVRATNRKGASRRAAYRFLNHVTLGRVSDGAEVPHGVPDLTRRAIADPAYVQSGLSTVVSSLSGEPVQDSWRFEVVRTDDAYQLRTNVDLERLSSTVRGRFGQDAQANGALLLGILHDAQLDELLAARLGSQLLTSDITSSLIQLRLAQSLRGPLTETGKEQVDLFQQVVLRGQSIGEAVRSGHKSLDQVLALVERARRFRQWVASQPMEAQLLTEYHAAAIGDTWAKRLPSKNFRWALFTAIGAAADVLLTAGASVAAGVALSAAEEFIVERLAAGWNPSHFVDRELKPFVGDESKSRESRRAGDRPKTPSR